MAPQLVDVVRRAQGGAAISHRFWPGHAIETREALALPSSEQTLATRSSCVWRISPGLPSRVTCEPSGGAEAAAPLCSPSLMVLLWLGSGLVDMDHGHLRGSQFLVGNDKNVVYCRKSGRCHRRRTMARTGRQSHACRRWIRADHRVVIACRRLSEASFQHRIK